MSREIIVHVDGIKCRANEINVTCYDSYQIQNDCIERFINRLRSELSSVDGFNYKRSAKSWIKEMYVHNILYRKGLWIVSTKDTDLTEGEEWYRILFYNILYYFHKYIWINVKNLCIKLGTYISSFFKK